MRRKEREIDNIEELNEIIMQGKYAVIAMCRDNEPYVITLSYGFDQAKNTLYFHSALEGLKLDIIDYNPDVSATIIDDQGYLPGECAHKYRSVVLDGKIVTVSDIEEKKHGMNVLLNHLEDNPATVKKRTLKNDQIYDKFAILRLDISDITGKKGQ